MACPCLTDFKAVSNNTAKCVCYRVLSQLKETNTYEQVYNTTLTCLGHWTQVIIPRPLRCISRLRLHSLVPLQGPLHHYGLQSFLCSKTVISHLIFSLIWFHTFETSKCSELSDLYLLLRPFLWTPDAHLELPTEHLQLEAQSAS